MAVQWARICYAFILVTIWTVNIPNIISDILATLDKDCSHSLCAAVAPRNLFFLLPWWTAFFFKIFFLQFFSLPDCFSNMQNQANCLSVNIICDFSCTYTFYVLSDWVNGDSKTDSCCSMISKKKRRRRNGWGWGEEEKDIHFNLGLFVRHIGPTSRPKKGLFPVSLVCASSEQTTRA